MPLSSRIDVTRVIRNGFFFAACVALIVLTLPAAELAAGQQPDSLQPVTKEPTEKARGPLPPAILLPFRVCLHPSECVSIQNGCCGCLTGEPLAAVNRKFVSAFTGRFDCSGAQCGARRSELINCAKGTVECLEQLCVFTPEPPPAPLGADGPDEERRRFEERVRQVGR